MNANPSGGRSPVPNHVTVIVPARDEEESIGRVLADLPGDRVDTVIVVDNGSHDRTAEVAARAGARVVREEQPGYGAACLRGIASLPEETGVVVFLDADYSDHPDELPRVVDPVLAGDADLVIGSRILGSREPGALLPQALLGNRLAVTLIRWIWKHRYTDLGPFRAIRRDALERLDLRDRDFGWTVEMQIRALEEGLRVMETPVSYRTRIGTSKITGTLRGTLRAGWKILFTIGKRALLRRRASDFGRGRP